MSQHSRRVIATQSLPFGHFAAFAGSMSMWLRPSSLKEVKLLESSILYEMDSLSHSQKEKGTEFTYYFMDFLKIKHNSVTLPITEQTALAGPIIK